MVDYLDARMLDFNGEKNLCNFSYKFNATQDKINDFEDYINLIFRNTLLIHVEQMLIQIKNLANEKQETPEEMMLRVSKDSAK
jgi:hypothetical protein